MAVIPSSSMDKKISWRMRWQFFTRKYTGVMWGLLPKGTSHDGTLQRSTYESYRRGIATRLGSVPVADREGRSVPPPGHAEPPEWWPDDLPLLRAKEWNHALYGEQRADYTGGHAAGFGWIAGRPEFPASWDAERIARATEAVLRNTTWSSLTSTVEDIVDGVLVRVSLASRRGSIRITSIYPVESQAE